MSCKILANDKISDKDFLELMIKHHNIAVKMSQIIMMTSEDDFIIDFARRTIFNQSNEVTFMEKISEKNIPNMQNEKSCNCGNSVISAQIEKIYPNIFANLKCKEAHFHDFTTTPVQLLETSSFESFESTNMKSHESVHIAQSNINKVKMSDQEYINHMMDHHKSGIDLAKLVIKSTKEPKILHLAQTMIFDQEKELFMINNLYGCIKYNWRQNKQN